MRGLSEAAERKPTTWGVAAVPGLPKAKEAILLLLSSLISTAHTEGIRRFLTETEGGRFDKLSGGRRPSCWANQSTLVRA